MKLKVYIGVGISVLLVLVGVVRASESSSYRLEQIPDVPPTHQSEVGSESSAMVEASEGSVVDVSDLLTKKQLEAWNNVGVVGHALYVQKGTESVSYGIDVEPSTIMLNEQNAYEDATPVRVVDGTRYPYVLFAQVTGEPRAQKNDRILPTLCSKDHPCTDSQAAEWSKSELGAGFAVRGMYATFDMRGNDAYRSFVQNTVAYPVAESIGYAAKESTYTISIRVRPVKEQRTQSYWGRMRLILMPNF